MSNKLQELTERLYQEGLSKGRLEGEKLLADAKLKAEEMIASATKEADGIIKKAQQQADSLREKAESDIRMASAQALQATKKDIEELLVGRITSDKVGDALSNADFVKEIISAVASRFSASESSDLSLILPAGMQAELEPWISERLQKEIGAGIEAEFSKKTTGGFKIGPKDGSWFISLTDETFKSLIAEYLRPVTRKLLFGE